MPATLSIRGLYTINNSLFSGMFMPDGMNADDRQIIVNNILNEYAELEILYPDPIFMQDAVTKWSRKELPTWQRIYNASIAEYDPIENYNRTESSSEAGSNSKTGQSTGSETHSGTDTTSHTGTDSSESSNTHTHTGTVTDANTGNDVLTMNRAGFDSNSLVTTGTDTTQHGHTITRTHNETEGDNAIASLTHGESVNTVYGHGIAQTENNSESGTSSISRSSHISGNIGVTTSQQMLEQELLVAPKLNVYNYIMESFKNRFCLEVY